MPVIAMPGLYLDPSTKCASLVFNISITSNLSIAITLSLTLNSATTLSIQLRGPLAEGYELLSPPATFTLL